MATFLRAMEPRGELSWRKVEEKRRREATASEEVASEQLLRASCLSCVAEVAKLARRRVESFLPVGVARETHAGGAESLSRRAGVRAGGGGGGRAASGGVPAGECGGDGAVGEGCGGNGDVAADGDAGQRPYRARTRRDGAACVGVAAPCSGVVLMCLFNSTSCNNRESKSTTNTFAATKRRELHNAERGDDHHQRQTQDDEDPVDHLLSRGHVGHELPVEEGGQGEAAEGDGEAAQWR